MPRQARQRSESGTMHLIVRGIGRQTLFEAREDYAFFLAALERFSRETGVTILAYCLMENHAHLLVRDADDQISRMMKKLGVSYSQYFNRKYRRQGHLFQDRYLSEAVEDDRYLLTVFRYILNNPRKAGLCDAADYEWSSYRLYDQPPGLVDTTLLREMIGNAEHYRAFITAPNDDRCLDFDASRRDDDWARQIIRKRLNLENGIALQSLDRKARDEALRLLLREGLTIRQLERLTGIGRGIIQRKKR